MAERKRDNGLYVARPDTQEDLLWLVDESTVADADYPSLDCREFRTAWLEFIFAGGDSEVGVLFIEWSMDNETFYPFAFDAEKFSVINAAKLTVDEAAGTVTLIALDDEARFSLGVEKPPPFLRGRWDVTTGGSATGMSGKSFGRG